MASKGYNSYRGRSGGGGRAAWIVALVLVLLAAVGYLVSQRFVVYDEDGHAHWELPFGKNNAENHGNPISPDDVNIERQEPDNTTPQPEPEPEPEPEPAGRKLAELHARELEYGCLWWDPQYVVSLAEESMMIEVKRWNGGVTYGTEVEVPAGALVERDVTRGNLEKILAADRYAVAHLVCFCDPACARTYPEAALTTAEDWLWYDANGRAWLDPGSAEALSYVTALCQECAAMGFDEIMLDAFCYPAAGEDGYVLGEGTDRTAVLRDFLTALRKALPEEIALGVTYRGEMGPLDGESGLTAELLACFDRIYVDGEVDLPALTGALPVRFDRAGGLAVLTWTKPESGGYVLLS